MINTLNYFSFFLQSIWIIFFPDQNAQHCTIGQSAFAQSDQFVVFSLFKALTFQYLMMKTIVGYSSCTFYFGPQLHLLPLLLLFFCAGASSDLFTTGLSNFPTSAHIYAHANVLISVQIKLHFLCSSRLLSLLSVLLLDPKASQNHHSSIQIGSLFALAILTHSTMVLVMVSLLVSATITPSIMASF